MPNPALNAGRNEMAFLLTDIDDWQTIARGLRPGIGLAVIDHNVDALAAMAAWSRQHHDLDAIHIFSHGEPGRLHLGTSLLDAATAVVRQSEIAQIGASLADDGEILLYACELAKGDGKDLVHLLERLTGVSIAASTTLTGADARGGDWSLDFTPSGRASRLPITDHTINAFTGVLIPLPDHTGTAGDDLLTGTDSAEVFDAGAGNDTLISGGGDDTMTGGAGNDVFVLGPDTPVITDFAPGDIIRLPQMNFSGIVAEFPGEIVEDNVLYIDYFGDDLLCKCRATDGTVYQFIIPWLSDFEVFAASGTDFMVRNAIKTASSGFNTLTGEGIEDNRTVSGLDDIIYVESWQHIEGSVIDGGAGNDTLYLRPTGSSNSFDLTTAASVTGIEEIILGSGGYPYLTVSPDKGLYVDEARTIPVRLTDKGDGRIHAKAAADGTSVDLSSHTITGFSEVRLITGTDLIVSASQVGQGKIQYLVGSDSVTDNVTINVSGGATTLDLSEVELYDFDSLTTNATTLTLKDIHQGLTSISMGTGGDLALNFVTDTIDLSGVTIASGTRISSLATDPVTIIGSNTDDFLVAGPGSADSLNGGAGNDTLDAGTANDDVLTGGTGRDQFRFSGAGTATITDFSDQDVIRILGSSFTNDSFVSKPENQLAAGEIRVEQDAGNNRTVLSIGLDTVDGADVTITLDGLFDPTAFKANGTDIALKVPVPVVTLPSTPTISENGSAALPGITVSKDDATGTESFTVVLSANDGVFSIDGTGVTVSGPTSNVTALTLTGTLADLNTALGTLQFSPEPDHTGTASVRIRITDSAEQFDEQVLSVTVPDVDPVLSNQSFDMAATVGGGSQIGTITVTGDTNGLSWSIIDGTGAGLFTINGNGTLRLANDASLDPSITSYTLVIAVDDEDADSDADTTATITINVTPVNQNPPQDPPDNGPGDPPAQPPVEVPTAPIEIPPSPGLPDLPAPPPATRPIQTPPAPAVPVTSTVIEDGVPVGRGSGVNDQGRTIEQVVVSPVPATRTDVGGTPTGNADIRLGGTPDAPTLVASLPVGVGIQANGVANLTLAELEAAAAIEAAKVAVEGSAQTGTINLAGLSTTLPGNTPVTLRTITPMLESGVTAAPAEPIVISVPTSGTSGMVSAVVIDTRSLPPGTMIELRGIDYAIINGEVFVIGGTGQNVAIGDDGRQYIRLGPDDDTIRGGGGDDTVGSGEGRDLIYGDDGNDSVFGGEGYDRLHGGTGNDTLDGGSGVDTARFEADFSDVVITRTGAGSFTVTHNNGGSQGSDVLQGVELLRLNDRVILLEQAQVQGGIAVGGFNDARYLAEHQDVASAVTSGMFRSGHDHWLAFGQYEGRATTAMSGMDSRLFDEGFYLAQNPDVAAAVANGTYASGLTHFILHGQAEGRDANALFDSEWYLARHADVAAAVNAGIFTSAIEHYSLFGWTEDRDPSVWFDSSAYLATHSDVAAAGIDPLAHFLTHGQAEGRIVTAADTGMWL